MSIYFWKAKQWRSCWSHFKIDFSQRLGLSPVAPHSYRSAEIAVENWLQMSNHLCLISLWHRVPFIIFVPQFCHLYKRRFIHSTDVYQILLYQALRTRDTVVYNTDPIFSQLRAYQGFTLVFRLKISSPRFTKLYIPLFLYTSLFSFFFFYSVCCLLFIEPTADDSGSGHLHLLLPFPEAVPLHICMPPLFKCSLSEKPSRVR